ncbi:MAG: PDZ domain-containing protein [Chlorobia bacterium]|nr:PDZ domain-containing protein [Fimbriimonadaceae bacterium]
MKLPTLFATAALAISLLAPNAQAQSAKIDAAGKKEVLEVMTKRITQNAYVPGVDFNKLNALLEKQKADLDKAETEDQFSDAVNTALQEFGFSHIVLMQPVAVNARVNRSSVGIGVNIQPHEDGILVVRVVPKAPADEAGIVAGDILVKANGKQITDPSDLRGEEGQQVTISVRKADGKMKDYTITRRKFSTVRPEELKWVDKDTAAISIYTFDLSYDKENVEKLMAEASKAKNLIVDLRNNGGGAVMNMTHFLGMVLPKETKIGTFVNKRLVDDFVKEKGGNPNDLKAIAEFSEAGKLRPWANVNVPVFKGKIAVLVNGASGSASEITAQALKEYVNAPIVGTKSAGAVLVSVMQPLVRGFQVQFPISDYVSAKGVRLEHNGVPVDVEAKTPQEIMPGKADPAWQFALDLLAKINLPKN